jgi:hypothetical protein
VIVDLSIKDVERVFNDLIEGRITRHDADRWAYERMNEFDSGALKFNPTSEEDLLWSAVQYLYGIDILVSPNKYLHSLDDIKKKFQGIMRLTGAQR